MRDCFQEILESVSVLKVCMECGIVAEVLRANFQIKLTNVFDPQVVDGFLAAGFDAASLVPDQYYGLRTLLRYYLPTKFETFPTYCFKSQVFLLQLLEKETICCGCEFDQIDRIKMRMKLPSLHILKWNVV